MMVSQELINLEVNNRAYRGVFAFDEEKPPLGGVLLCSPNPFLGGQIDNPVVHALSEELNQLGFATLLWEYRALHPEVLPEKYDEMRQRFWDNETIPTQMPDDILDGEFFLKLLQQREFGGFNRNQLSVAGYSYGGALALILAQQDRLPVFSVSPPLKTLPQDIRLHPGMSVLYANNDLAVCKEDILLLELRSEHQWLSITELSGDDHFYLDQLDSVKEEARRWAGRLSSKR